MGKKRKGKKAALILLTMVLITAVLTGPAYLLIKSRDFQLFGKIVSRADTDMKKVALTFDDGPTDMTPEILELLDVLGVRATFFLTGKDIEQNLEYAKAIAAAGHQIGNHSYSHERLVFKSMSFIENEIDSTNALIREAGYTGEIVFRPPYCNKLVLLPFALSRRGMTSVTWDVEPESYEDVAASSKGISEYVLSHAKGGSIILLHIMYGSRQNSIDAVAGIVEGLRSKGYRFVTVNDLIN